MKAIAVVLGFTAYTVYSWGYILIKGYNITLREWVTPLHPYSGSWPAPKVPQGSIFPTSSKSGSSQASSAPASMGATPVNKGSGASQKQHKQGTGATQKQGVIG